jgi:hypothetical protein
MRGTTMMALLLTACASAPQPGDALIYKSRSPTPTFWETTDVATNGNAVYTCTGVASFGVHDASKPQNLKYEGAMGFAGSDSQYARCSHIHVDGDRAVITARADEVQTSPFMALLDVSKPLSPKVLDEGTGGGVLIEEAALVGDRLYVAATDAGLRVYDVSGDKIGSFETIEMQGTVTRVAPYGTGVAAGTTEGTVYIADADGTLTSIDVGASVQALQTLPDGGLAVALGSAGLGLIRDARLVTTVSTHGTALRLDLLATGELVVANWSDIRLYTATSDTLTVRAVDAVFQADDRPRHLAVAASGSHVFAGEWTGLHALEYRKNEFGAEFTPSTLAVAIAEDGEPHSATLAVTNEGSESLEVSKIELGGGWTASPETLTLAAGGDQVVTLSHGGSSGVSQKQATFHTNDPDEPRAQVELRIGSNRTFIGDPAPDFTYTSLNGGETVTLSNQRGSVVVLSYFATF